MRILIAEDDMISRKFLQKFLSTYGDCDLTIDGIESVDAFLMAHEESRPYDLVCLDIMMPKLDGLRVLKIMREFEGEKGIEEDKRVKIIMTTALIEQQTINQCISLGCNTYITKPIDTNELINIMKDIKLVI